MIEPTRKAFHIINRMAYGPALGDVERLAAKGDTGIEAWIEGQLHPETLAEPELEARVRQQKLLTLSIPELHAQIKNKKAQFKAAKATAGSKAMDEMETDRDILPRRMLIELVAGRLLRGVESRKQFQERLVDFWFNHFNVDFSKGQVKFYLIAYERDTIRPRLFGKFRELLGAVAKSPAMLFYLDNFQSVRDGFTPKRNFKHPDQPPVAKGLNENYGRELLELHTLGVDGGYTQKDVRETARALTGWTLDQPRRASEFKFRPMLHDTDAKHILTLDLPAGGGQDDGEKVLDMLARHPATAHFIAKKLCVKFIADHPPETAVKSLAAVFQKTDGDLRAVYQALFRLPEFWAAETLRAKIKTPWELIVSSARAVGATVHVGEKSRINNFLNTLGEPLYRCAPPTGFKAVAEPWVNAGALVTRITFGLAVGADRISDFSFDRDALKTRLEKEGVQGNAASIDRVSQWLLAGELAEPTRKRLEQELDSEDKLIDPATTVTTAQAAGAAGGAPMRHMNLNLAKIIGLVLGSPEFQRS